MSKAAIVWMSEVAMSSRSARVNSAPWRNSFFSLLIVISLAFTASGASLEVRAAGSSVFQNLVQRAAAAREKGDSEQAIELYRKATAQRPDWQEGWWYLGTLLYDSGQFPAARLALHKLTVLNPKLGGAWGLLGLTEFQSARYDDALKALQRARSLGVGEDAGLTGAVDFDLAVLLNVHGESEAADSLLYSLLLRGHHSEDLQVALGLALLRVPILPSQLDPSKDAMVHDAGSLAAVMAHRQYEAAEAGFDGFLTKYPGIAFVHYAWGTMLAKEGKDSSAEAQFEEETKMNPNSALAYSEWAYLAMKAARYGQAISLAQKAIGLSANSYAAHYVLGSSFLATGKTEASVAELEQALKMVPDSPEIHYRLSHAYAKLGKKAFAAREAAEFQRLKSKQPVGAGSGQPNSGDAQTVTSEANHQSYPQQ